MKARYSMRKGRGAAYRKEMQQNCVFAARLARNATRMICSAATAAAPRGTTQALSAINRRSEPDIQTCKRAEAMPRETFFFAERQQRAQQRNQTANRVSAIAVQL